MPQPKPPVFPFDIEDHVRSVCDGCPGDWEDPHGCESCDCLKHHQIDIAALHNAVVAAEHEPTPEELNLIEEDFLCEYCEFSSSVCTFWGGRYDPPEYEPWCDACQAIVEEVACEGRFFKRREDEPKGL